MLSSNGGTRCTTAERPRTSSSRSSRTTEETCHPHRSTLRAERQDLKRWILCLCILLLFMVAVLGGSAALVSQQWPLMWRVCVGVARGSPPPPPVMEIPPAGRNSTRREGGRCESIADHLETMSTRCADRPDEDRCVLNAAMAVCLLTKVRRGRGRKCKGVKKMRGVGEGGGRGRRSIRRRERGQKYNFRG